MTRTKREDGFTLAEVCVVSAIMGPLLVAFMGASNVVGTAMAENERSADVTTVARGIGVQLARFVRQSAPDTLNTKPVPLVRVLQTDVVAVPASQQFYGQTSNLARTSGLTSASGSAVVTSTTSTTTKTTTTYNDLKLAMYADGSISTEEKAILARVQAGTLSLTDALASVKSSSQISSLKGETLADSGGALRDIAQSGTAVTTATSLLDMKDESQYVTPYDTYQEYRTKYVEWYYASKNGSLKDNWKPMQQFMPTESIRFAAVEGTRSMNAKSRTLLRKIEFVRDPAEKLNAYDDDGDGMVDEGRLIMKYNNSTTILADNVEICTFTLEGRVLRFAIRCCRRDHTGRVHRTTIQKRILIRNNQ